MGISSSQLTFIFFRGVAQAPTSVLCGIMLGRLAPLSTSTQQNAWPMHHAWGCSKIQRNRARLHQWLETGSSNLLRHSGHAIRRMSEMQKWFQTCQAPRRVEGSRSKILRAVFAICSAVESPLILGEWYLFEWTENSTNWDCWTTSICGSRFELHSYGKPREMGVPQSDKPLDIAVSEFWANSRWDVSSVQSSLLTNPLVIPAGPGHEDAPRAHMNRQVFSRFVLESSSFSFPAK